MLEPPTHIITQMQTSSSAEISADITELCCAGYAGYSACATCGAPIIPSAAAGYQAAICQACLACGYGAVG